MGQTNDGYGQEDGYRWIDADHRSKCVVIWLKENVESEDGYGIIYGAVSPSGKIYIGQTIHSLWGRIKAHSREAYDRRCTGYNSKFYRAIRKYGGNIVWSALMRGIPAIELDEAEIRMIKEYDSFKHGYNSTEGGGGTRGHKISESLRRKVSEAGKKKVGDKNPMFGRKHTDETKAKFSKTHKGKKLSPEHIEALSCSRRGMRLSIEVKDRMARSRGSRPFIAYENGVEIGRFCSQRECSRQLDGFSRKSIGEGLKTGKQIGVYRFEYEHQVE